MPAVPEAGRTVFRDCVLSVAAGFRTLVGTTDTDYDGDLNSVEIEAKDIDYLLNEVNGVVSNVNCTKEDSIGAFPGLRVLKQSDQSSPSAVSRDWELHIADNGLLSSIGGKLTSARSDAAQIVDKVSSNLNRHAPGTTFANPFPWSPRFDFLAWYEEMTRLALNLGIDPESAKWLLYRHGSRVTDVFALCEDKPVLAKRIVLESPFIFADLLFCARTEMVVHLEDLLRRRLPLLILARLTRASPWTSTSQACGAGDSPRGLVRW